MFDISLVVMAETQPRGISGQNMSNTGSTHLLVELMSLFSNDAHNSHSVNLISQTKYFVLKTAIKEAYPELKYWYLWTLY